VIIFAWNFSTIHVVHLKKSGAPVVFTGFKRSKSDLKFGAFSVNCVIPGHTRVFFFFVLFSFCFLFFFFTISV